MWFLSYVSEQTDRQTLMLIAIPCTPTNGKVTTELKAPPRIASVQDRLPLYLCTTTTMASSLARRADSVAGRVPGGEG